MDGVSIERIIHMRRCISGPRSCWSRSRSECAGAATAADIAAAIDAAERRIRTAVPIARVIYIEPDIYRVPRPRSRETLTGADPHVRVGVATALAALQGRPVPSAEPEAELWLGAHPTAPSLVDGRSAPRDAIAADPVAALGATVVSGSAHDCPTC